SKIDLFTECKRCFYLDRRLGVGRPPGYPFALNSAVDELLKREFDFYRHRNESHPIQAKYGIDARPAKLPDLDQWRNNFVGVQYHHEPTNLLIFGAIDDVWINSKNELHLCDYKATSKEEATKELNDAWHDGYRRQMEIYQWLVARNGHRVSRRGYFVYTNGRRDRERFDDMLHFETHLIAYDGDSSWVEDTIIKLHQCLISDHPPEPSPDCDYCRYLDAVNGALRIK
ncbi:MAG: PD-(D/E)XK nuclease family protein, partial [Planctomycetes bacterium]|nr:PD-(D/E)XK nuclease family protein [Planctomycetota bacterium]